LLAGPDVFDQLVERVLHAVVGGDDAHPAAPDEHGQRRLEQLVELVVEGRLVDHDRALAAARVGGPAGERHDAKARGREADREGLDVLVGVVVFPKPSSISEAAWLKASPHRAWMYSMVMSWL
jgi:hypothetical protein